MKISKESTICKKYDNNGYGVIENAIYSKPACDMDNGNIFIEALQPPLSDTKDLVSAYSREIDNYSESFEKNKSDFDKRLSLAQLKYFRVYLPFEKEVEFEVYNTLVNSYRSRKLQIGDYYDNQKSRLIGNTCDSADSGFALLGYSGCGKSTAIKLYTERLPQTLIHNVEGNKIIQIVYLTVSCTANSNFKALYGNIGREIDHALNTDIYERVINKITSLGKKQAKVEELIERFNIGIIIFDEIQLLDFKSSQEASYESLMVIANNTKVGMAVIGTEDSYLKIFNKLRTARRLGKVISASLYCDNKKYYELILKKLWKYQWFDDHVDLTEEIVDTFYSITKGIIDFTVSLYISIQNEYLKSKKNVVIDSDYINMIFDMCYPNLRTLLDDVNNVNSRNAIQAILSETKLLFDKELENDRQQKEMNEVYENELIAQKESMIEEAISSIQHYTDDYSFHTINEVVRKVSEEDGMDSTTKIVRKALSNLKSKNKEKRTKVKISSADMFDDIMNN